MRYLGWYKLVDKKPVKCDVMEASKTLEDTNRVVAKDNLGGDIMVSTIFLGIDHNFGDDDSPPILFETMVFGGKFGDYQQRYATWEEAEIGHRSITNLMGCSIESEPKEIVKVVKKIKNIGFGEIGRSLDI